MSDDRPKKSWRELDRARDKGGSGTKRRDPDDVSKERLAKTQAYSKYKQNLDKLFTPGGAALPESLRSKLGPQSEDSKSKRAALDALRSNPGEETLRAFLAAGEPLPPDARLLMGLLDVGDEALLRQVLSALLELVEGGTKPNRMLLLGRIEALQNRVEDSESLDLLKTLRAAMG